MAKKFLVTQKFDASAERVTDLFRSESTWQGFRGLPFVGDPTLQSFAHGDPVKVAMAYRVSIDLPALAEKFIDPQKMSFVEESQLGADGSGSFEIVPDHYKRLLAASGRIEMVPFGDDYCERLIQGSVDVSLGWSGMLFEGPVEEAIVNGLSQALHAQAGQISLG